MSDQIDDQAPDESAVVPPPVAVEALAPEREIRSPGSWVLLISIFVLLIGLAVWPEKPSARKSSFNPTEMETSLKMTLLSRHFLSLSKSPDAEATKDADSKLREVYDKSYKDRLTDQQAAMFTLSVGKELGIPSDPGAIKTLTGTGKKADEDFVRVYTAATLDSDWVRSATLPPTFLGRLVKAQALEKAGVKDASKNVVSTGDAVLIVVVFVGALLAVVLGLIVAISFGLSVASSGFKPKGHPLAGLSRADADRLALRMALFLVMLILVPSLVAAPLKDRFVVGLASVLGELVLFALMVWVGTIPVLGVADPVKKLIGTTQGWPKLAGIGFLAFLANLPIIAVLALVAQLLMPHAAPPTHPLSEQMGMGASPLTILLMFVLASVMAPLIEEVSFRGMFFPALTRYMKPVTAMLVSGFFFGAIHPQGPVLWASLAAIGAMSAFLAYMTGSLIPSIVMHGIHNAAILTLSLVLVY